MKGYIIDSNLKGIFPIELDKELNYKDIYKYLHTDVKRCSAFDAVRVGCGISIGELFNLVDS